MDWFIRLCTSSVGKKFIMSLTGLFLCTFLVVHLTGNLLLLKSDGGVAFNHYAEFMSTNIGLRIMEIGLVLGFLFHIIDGVVLTLQNWASRPSRYAVDASNQNAGWTSRHMFFTGGLVFLFLVIHIENFVIKHRIIGTKDTMYDSVREAFTSPYYAGFYILAFILLGLHLNHGFQSAFQSLGLNHSKYNSLIKFVGTAFCILIPLGYTVIPVYFLTQKGTLTHKKAAKIEKKIGAEEVRGTNQTAPIKKTSESK